MREVASKKAVLLTGLALLVFTVSGYFIGNLFPIQSEAATNPGTCLPIEKGGTGCDSTALTEYIKADMVNSIKTDVAKVLHPVGSIYITTTSTNPSSYLGGTWAQFGQGRTLVGMGSNGTTSYSTVQATGGSDSVTLTLSQVPAHSHTARWYGSSYQGTYGDTFGGFNSQGHGTWQDYTYIQTNSQGGGGSHENRMPYITVYFWRRTA